MADVGGLWETILKENHFYTILVHTIVTENDVAAGV